jgi:hypothetical protein
MLYVLCTVMRGTNAKKFFMGAGFSLRHSFSSHVPHKGHLSQGIHRYPLDCKGVGQICEFEGLQIIWDLSRKAACLFNELWNRWMSPVGARVRVVRPRAPPFVSVTSFEVASLFTANEQRSDDGMDVGCDNNSQMWRKLQEAPKRLMTGKKLFGDHKERTAGIW